MLLFVGPAASGCSAVLDYADEPENCQDGVDNDVDGRVDCADPDCDGLDRCAETQTLCDDGRDNDGDGEIDANDFGCWLEPRRIDVVRCESAVQTDLTPEDLLDADGWLGGRLAVSESGLLGPAAAGEVELVWGGLVTGAYFGRLSGDPGMALDVTLGLEPGWETVEVALDVADGVPLSDGTNIALRGDRTSEGLDVTLVAGSETIPVGTFDFDAHRLALGLRAANPVEEGCRDCSYGLVVLAEAESAETRRALEPLIVPERPLPVLGAPPLRLVLRLRGAAESIALRELTVSRPRRDLCTQPVPQAELDGWEEVHALTGTTDLPPVLCLSGYRRDPETHEGELRLARGLFQDRERVANTLAIPRWTPTRLSVADARIGVVGARGDAPGFVLVTQREDRDPAGLRVSTSVDCDAFEPPTALVLEGFDDVLRQDLGAEEAAGLIPLGLSSPVDGGVSLWLLRATDPEDTEHADRETDFILPCLLDLARHTCELSGEPVKLNAARVAPPAVTAIPGGRTWALLEARSSDSRGQLRLLQRDGSRVGIAMRDRGVILDGAGQVGLYDRYIHQGVAWLYPTVVADPGASSNQTRPGWIVYTAGEDAAAPRRIGMARLDLIVGALEP